MSRETWFPRVCAVALLTAVGAQLWGSGMLWAFPDAARRTGNACVACHTNPAGGSELTDAGKSFKKGKPLAPAAAKKAVYVGENRCRTCHMQEHKGWSETAHARSMATLAAGDPEKIAAMAAKLKVKLQGSAAKNESCVTCHVTGFQLPGGYPQADSVKNAGVASVGCESCHGPGSLHVAALMADKKKLIHPGSEAMCKQCHTPVISPEFDFEEWAKRGTHASQPD